jgi:hypothetical protein
LIPATAHFVWYGNQLPWIYALAIKSAALRGAFERVVLHHQSDLTKCAVWPELLRLPNFEPRRLEEMALVRQAGGDELAELCGALKSNVAKSNLIRASILHLEGGVYLDMDTVTVRSLKALRESSSAFLGLERIVFPYRVWRSRNPWVLASAGIRSAVRFVFRLMPRGYRSFRRLERWYPLAANGAILGAAPKHPFVARLIEEIMRVPQERWQAPHALGTHLLQETLENYRTNDIQIFSPEYFYPLGPDISMQWFHCGNSRTLDDVITPETRIVHWYASIVRGYSLPATKRIIHQMDDDYVRKHAPRQLFSMLALPFLDTEGPKKITV